MLTNYDKLMNIRNILWRVSSQVDSKDNKKVKRDTISNVLMSVARIVDNSMTMSSDNDTYQVEGYLQVLLEEELEKILECDI